MIQSGTLQYQAKAAPFYAFKLLFRETINITFNDQSNQSQQQQQQQQQLYNNNNKKKYGYDKKGRGGKHQQYQQHQQQQQQQTVQETKSVPPTRLQIKEQILSDLTSSNITHFITSSTFHLSRWITSLLKQCAQGDLIVEEYFQRLIYTPTTFAALASKDNQKTPDIDAIVRGHLVSLFPSIQSGQHQHKHHHGHHHHQDGAKKKKLNPLIQTLIPVIVSTQTEHLSTDYAHLLRYYFLVINKTTQSQRFVQHMIESNMLTQIIKLIKSMLELLDGPTSSNDHSSIVILLQNHFLPAIYHYIGADADTTPAQPYAERLLTLIINDDKLRVLLFGRDNGYGLNGHFSTSQLIEGLSILENLIQTLETFSSDTQTKVQQLLDRHWRESLLQSKDVTYHYWKVRQLLLYYNTMPQDLRDSVNRFLFNFLRHLELQPNKLTNNTMVVFKQLVPILFNIVCNAGTVSLDQVQVEGLATNTDNILLEYLQFVLTRFKNYKLVLSTIKNSFVELLITTLVLDQMFSASNPTGVDATASLSSLLMPASSVIFLQHMLVNKLQQQQATGKDGCAGDSLYHFIIETMIDNSSILDRLLVLLSTSDYHSKTLSIQMFYLVQFGANHIGRKLSYWETSSTRIELLYKTLLDPITSDTALHLLRLLLSEHAIDPLATLESLFLQLTTNQNDTDINCNNSIVLIEETLRSNMQHIERVIKMIRTSLFNKIQNVSISAGQTASTSGAPPMRMPSGNLTQVLLQQQTPAPSLSSSQPRQNTGNINCNLLILLQKLTGLTSVAEDVVALAVDAIHLYPESTQLLQFQLLASSMEHQDNADPSIGVKINNFVKSRLGSIVEGLTSPNSSIRKMCLTILQEFIEMGYRQGLHNQSIDVSAVDDAMDIELAVASTANGSSIVGVDPYANKKLSLDYINYKIAGLLLVSEASDTLLYLREAVDLIQIFVSRSLVQ
ncbi:hypothetical protein SAMD00019534_028480 [Acytostelium subglobosum LB1]|uniref:hypothetical protein n=1 Tax=Acytostelium subglobosum LB1 TaxID=1410327 RepID=UPI000644B267|nr:hypothetical protein SAMD00019534_028480 [Acytostelium subglobosum LB1]GAM19673.1 hypothetical protein SAMD00019534_028480 [Acytostelium subglobosum LB1]|eukprot:XP_012756435.1 hypothetical protein SAMD00019534_028480 [Acytostelium subglobosum LB1]